jgi:RNA polymerase sigma-70 factor, ECF subfamily
MSALPSLHRADRTVVGADAAGELYQQYGSRIFAFCLSRLGNREEAEDATQTTFLNAFRSLHDGLVPRFELAWLFRIADNVCRDRRKSAWRRGRVEATRDLQELQDVVSAPERRSDGLVGLQTALAGLPERQRRAILLREWQGLSYAEIARELGLTKAAVETLIFRARRSLARGLEAPQAPPPRRARAGFDAGWLLGVAKSLFAGGGAAKVAASVAAVAGAGLLVAAPIQERSRQAPTERKDVRAPAAPPRDASIRPMQNGTIATLPTRSRGAEEQTRPSAASKREGQATVPRATGTASVPSGKRGEPTRPEPTPATPASSPARPAPAGETPPSTPGTAPAPAASPPPAPPAALPSLPPVHSETPLEPPAVPPPPDLPVDVPSVPEVPGLPGLPGLP